MQFGISFSKGECDIHWNKHSEWFLMVECNMCNGHIHTFNGQMIRIYGLNVNTKHKLNPIRTIAEEIDNASIPAVCITTQTHNSKRRILIWAIRVSLNWFVPSWHFIYDDIFTVHRAFFSASSCPSDCRRRRHLVNKSCSTYQSYWIDSIGHCVCVWNP